MNGTDSTENIDNYLVKCAADSSSSSSETDRIRESIKSNSPTHFQREKVHATNSKDGRGELNPKRNESIVIAASALSMLGEDKNASRRLSGSGSLEENLIFQRAFASKSGDKAGENDDSDAGNKKPASSKKKSPITAQKYAAKHKFPREMPIIPQQRHIPSHKKSSCALTFPERLLAMLDYADKMKAELADHGHEPDTYCLSWLPDGKSFLVRDPVACTQTIIPLFFKQAKFTSITRKLYRWGFHQVERNNSVGPPLPPDAMIFANENFQRDARHKIANMKSMTTPNQNRKLESTPKREGGGENERTSSSAIAAGSNTLHLHAATSANGRNNDGNDVLSSGYARNPHQTLDLQSIIAAQSQQSQKRALLEGILASCNGNLSQVDPGIFKTLLFPQMNCGVSDSQSSHNAVIPPTVANTTSHPTLNLEQLLPLLRNCNGGNVINHHFNQQQQQNYQEQEKRSLLNSIGLKSPYSMVIMVPHHYPPSQSLPQQGLSTLRSGNLHENSMASVNNVFDKFLPYIQSASINTNPVAQDVVFSNEKNFSRLAQQQKPQQQQISRDDMNIHQALKTVMSQTMSSHQQELSASAPPPNHSQTAPLNRFQNLSHLQRDQLIQIFRFGAETLENGSIQEQDVILQIILSFLQNC